MLKTGEVIAERYRIEKILGEGGMGRVYLVEDLRLGSNWVLKEFTFTGKNPVETKLLEEHFITEAKICASLSHPGIPRVIDYFTVGERHYLAEEYIIGETLLEHIESGKLTTAEIIPIALKLCDVLEYVHSHNIIYRDLKPDNIMLTGDGGLKLIDFGIARVYKAGRTKDTLMMETPGYAAPEQHGTSQADSRSDVYSLGAVMHHMLTGIDPRIRPFYFETPSDIGVSVMPYLDGIIMKALSHKIEERYASMKEMRQAVEAVAKEMDGAFSSMNLPIRPQLFPLKEKVEAKASLPLTGTESKKKTSVFSWGGA